MGHDEATSAGLLRAWALLLMAEDLDPSGFRGNADVDGSGNAAMPVAAAGHPEVLGALLSESELRGNLAMELAVLRRLRLGSQPVAMARPCPQTDLGHECMEDA